MLARFASLACALTLAACAAQEKVLLTAAVDQEAIVRNGVPVLVSNKKNLVMLRPNARQFAGHTRPAFTIIVRNQTNRPETLLESTITAHQTIGRKQVAVRVIRHHELVAEEETRQTVAAVAVALGGVGRAMSAANAGRVTTYGDVSAHGPYGSSYGTYHATTYDPLRAQAAQSIAAADTAADFAMIREQGERNLASLEQTILKDNTVMPGEWYGGTIVLEPPARSAEGARDYAISVAFAGEEHVFSVSQVAR